MSVRPKVIHYCWFSKEKKPRLIRKCLKSWQQIMPDYYIKCWDGESFDFDSVPFVEEAIENKKRAFAADYVRLYALRKEAFIWIVMLKFSSVLMIFYIMIFCGN